MRNPIFLALLSASIISCTIPNGDLKSEYLRKTREVGITPVYPPRGEIQVGDVFMVYTPPDDIDQAVSLWVGDVPALREQADSYLRSRQDLGPRVGSNPNNLQQLPAVNFPTISGTAVSSVALGGVAVGRSSLFGLSGSERVNLDFGDVRAYGPPFLTATVPNAAICSLSPAMQRQFFQLQKLVRQRAEEAGQPDPGALCDERGDVGADCSVRFITRIYVTKSMTFNYDARRQAGGTASASHPLGSETSAPAPVSPVSVNIDATAANPDTATALINALKDQTIHSESVGSSAVFATQQGFQLTRTFTQPIAIGYESERLSLFQIHDACKSTSSVPQK